jgi:hypothetical protein
MEMPDGQHIWLPTVNVPGPDPEPGHSWDWGGTADAWNPHGAANMYYGFVVSGGHGNQDSGSGGGATADAGAVRYNSYWQGVANEIWGMYMPPFTQPSEPWGGPRRWDGPPSTYPFLRPSPDTRQASVLSNAAAYTFAAVGEALAPSAEAAIPGGGHDRPGRAPRPIGLLETNRTQIMNDLGYANELSQGGTGGPNWIADFFMEMATDPGFFPTELTRRGFDIVDNFIDVNMFTAPSGRIIGFTNSALPLFPVYGANPLYTIFGVEDLVDDPNNTLIGKRGVALSNQFGIPIFTWGDIIPHP